MATLNLGPFQGCARASSILLHVSDFGSGSSANSLSFRNDVIKLRKWESSAFVVLPPRAITSVEDESPAVASSQTIINRTLEDPKVSRKDLSILPSKFNKHILLHPFKFLCNDCLLENWNCYILIAVFNMITKLISSVGFLEAH